METGMELKKEGHQEELVFLFILFKFCSVRLYSYNTSAMKLIYLYIYLTFL